MSETLSGEELAALVRRVFQPGEEDQLLGVMVDLPDKEIPDNPEWKDRREMAFEWVKALAPQKKELGLQTQLILYRNARMNNADLPERAWIFTEDKLPATADELDEKDSEAFADIFRNHSILLAPTEFSATAPLKLAAEALQFRAATMPGFSRSMIPALRLDYEEINRRVHFLKDLVDRASGVDIVFEVDRKREHRLKLDLRHRKGHASGGLFPHLGTAGNLPSGETYIVPYEGEREGDPSRSAGELPVQFGNDIVVYKVKNNRAVEVAGGSPAAAEEAKRLKEEPAYGNLAELGLGVLSDFGIEPSGSILLDEKLALHIAFGRSDHFGGIVGAKQFSRPEAVVHIDRVYLESIQPRVKVKSAKLWKEEGGAVELIRDNRYVIKFG
jgi:leucyl aminopeptidase (aminopeptidase T)